MLAAKGVQRTKANEQSPLAPSRFALGYDAGDANLYRYVGNSPTNLVDPMGLRAGWELVKGTEVPLDKNTFKFGNGEGTVRVFKDATVRNKDLNRQVDGTIWIQFTTKGQDVGENTHWLQFINRYWISAETNKPFDPFVYSTIKEDQGTVWYYANKPHVDCENLKDPFYDSSGGHHRRAKDELSIVDRVGIDQEDRYNKVGAVFDTFLVSDGRVYYHVHWERVGVKKDGKWTVEYTNIKGEPILDGKLPPAFADKNLLIGYKKKGTGADLSDPVYVPNPVKQTK